MTHNMWNYMRTDRLNDLDVRGKRIFLLLFLFYFSLIWLSTRFIQWSFKQFIIHPRLVCFSRKIIYLFANMNECSESEEKNLMRKSK